MLHNAQCPDVIIVGAGIAGLEAARTLRASGHSVLILERNKQPGGRAIVGSIGDKNTPIDYGGAWIHGGRTNPLTLEVDAMGFNRQRTAFDFPYFRNSHKATKEEMQRFDTAAEQFEEAVSTAAHSVELERKLSEDACDKYKNGVLPNQIYDDLKSKLSSSKVSRIDNLRNLPVGTSDKFCALAKEDLRLTSDVAEHYTPSKEFDEDIIALLTANSGPLESAVELNKTSVVDTEYFEAGDHSGGDWLVDKGMGSFVKKLGEAVPQEVFRFNSTVTEIDYSERGVKVTTAADSYEGSYALVTVSVGVLQRRTIRFKPDLPLDKREAIDNVQMGNMQKVIVPFNMDIFPNIVSNSWVLYEGDLPPEVLPFAKEHHLPLVGKKRAVMAFVVKPLNQNIAIGFFGGDWAKALEEECSTASGMQSGESKPCDDLSLKITKLALHNISGKTSTDVEKAIQGKIHVTHWSLDPTSFGAYSAANLESGINAKSWPNQ